MNKFTEQFKAFVDKMKETNLKETLIHNKRYIGVAAILVILLVVIAIGFNGDKKRNSKNQQETQVDVDKFKFTEEFESDSNEDITNLLSQYYDAYVNGDVDKLGQIAYPMSDNEKSYVTVLSKYYEKVANIKYYSKPGIKPGSYMVSSRIDIKFADVDTTAPTLDFFLVETDENGKLYINNLYSIYNLNFMENSCDPDVYSVVQKYMSQEDFIKLQQEVQTVYNDAIASDEKLVTMIESTLSTAIKEWQASLTVNQSTEETAKEEQKPEESKEEQKPEEPQEEQQPQEQQPEEQKPEEQQPEQTQQEQQTPATTTYKTLDVVNVRDRASKEGALIGVYGEGALLNKTGEDGDWTIIDFNGTPGYVKTEFLEPVIQ